MALCNSCLGPHKSTEFDNPLPCALCSTYATVALIVVSDRDFVWLPGVKSCIVGDVDLMMF